MCVKYELDKEHQFILSDHELDLPYGISFLSLRLVKKCVPPSGVQDWESFSRIRCSYTHTASRVCGLLF